MGTESDVLTMSGNEFQSDGATWQSDGKTAITKLASLVMGTQKDGKVPDLRERDGLYVVTISEI